MEGVLHSLRLTVTVDGSIHSAAGHQLYQECRTLHGCPTGQTKITRGYDLPAKCTRFPVPTLMVTDVLHTVGPIGQDSHSLQSCYFTCMELAAQQGVKTVVFCGISTGIFGYPLYPASHIALRTVRDWMEKGNNRDMVLFSISQAQSEG